MIPEIDEPWNWAAVAQELRPMVERLTPDEALSIIRRLVATENENYLGPTLAGHIRGYDERRADERRRPR